MREATTAVGDPTITEDQAHIEVELTDGRRAEQVRRAVARQHPSAADRPQLEEKFRDQAVMVLPASDVETLIQLCWRIDQLDDVGDVVMAAVPAAGRTERQAAQA